ncbi:MAG: VOC family protein [bacterium]|nr:VOC family protein [bacterium]
MIDHVAIVVTDYEKSRAFYEKVLAPFGVGLQEEIDEVVAGFGTEESPFLWISASKPEHWTPSQQPGSAPTHIAFSAASRSVVDAFFAEGLRAGGKDNGAPGLRPHYHPNYYGAFILDPDGNNLEAVCHQKEFAEVLSA